MKAIPVLHRLLGATLAFQVVVGVAFWSGHWYSIVNVHRAVGMAFVLIAWTIAGISLANRQAQRAGVVTLAWGVVLAALGFGQQFILVNDLHWIVRVVHLAVGIATMPIIGPILRAAQPSLAATARGARPATAAP